MQKRLQKYVEMSLPISVTRSISTGVNKIGTQMDITFKLTN